MIDPKMIPPEVVEAAVFEWAASEGTVANGIRAAILAALNAWPGALRSPDEVIDGELLPPIISLPFLTIQGIDA